MQKVKVFLTYILFAFPITIILNACNDEYSNIGKEFVNTDVNITMLDTFSVKLSTILLDSVATSGQQVALVGQYTDGELGKITAKSYFQISTSGSKTINVKAEYDSITLILRYNKYKYGDTTQLQEINVYRLDKDIVLNDNGSLYNTSKLTYKTPSIGNIKYKPRPISKSKIEIKLSDDLLGKDLFSRIKDGDDTIADASKFKTFFKGILLAPGLNDDASIIGFNAADTSIYMRLYYHFEGTQYYADFNFTNYTYQFNQISSDRTGTNYLKKLTAKDSIISSGLTDNVAYSQAGTGLITKFEFPYIKNLLLANKYFSILKAELIIKPAKYSYSTTLALPSKMVLYTTNFSNEHLSYIADPTNPSYAASGSLVVDALYKLNTQYTYNVTSYVKGLLNTTSIEDMGLLFESPNFNNTLERTIIGDRNYQDAQILQNSQTSLRIYYLKYDAQK